MNPNLAKLQPYPFEKLARLTFGISPPEDKRPIVMSIGEPKHPSPAFILDALKSNLTGLANYPLTAGMPELREAIANWLGRRFKLQANTIDIDKNVLPVNGTREALFAFALCAVDPGPDTLVLMPNPFYQIYEGAAILAGATPWFLNATQGTPDFETVPEDVWSRCQLLYLCSPGNPTGAVIDQSITQKLIALADRHDFVIAADECYSEIYFDEKMPPIGLLQAANAMGRHDYARCVVFHSLSKRSSVPGLRSGFVAGDASIIEKFRLFRTYHGSAMSPPTQFASMKAWQDEEHVIVNRALYREKFTQVVALLRSVMDVQMPEGGFYLWLSTPNDDQEFARDLFTQQNVTVLPGSYLSRQAHGGNPGHGRVRLALVPPLEECMEAARRICQFVRGN
jgi:N-succinyldiaminopimelate aminotransferase